MTRWSRWPSQGEPVIYAGIPPFVFTTWCYYGQEVFSRASDVVKASGVKGLFIQGENDVVVPLRGASLYEGMEGSGQKLHLTDSTHKAPWLSKEARKYISDEIEPELSKLDLNNKEEIDSFIASVDKEKAALWTLLWWRRSKPYSTNNASRSAMNCGNTVRSLILAPLA